MPEVNGKGLWLLQRHKDARQFPVARNKNKVFTLDESRRSISELSYSGYLHVILPSIIFNIVLVEKCVNNYVHILSISNICHCEPVILSLRSATGGEAISL